MDKSRKKRNWMARQIVDIKIDDSATKKIKLDLPECQLEGNYDDSNVLALPSTKRKTTKSPKNQKPAKLLSRKKRKRLELVLANKAKKCNRAGLLESLEKVQATADELRMYVSTAHMQTKGILSKRQGHNLAVSSTESVGKIKSVRGSNRKSNLQEASITPESKSSSSDSGSEMDEDITELTGRGKAEDRVKPSLVSIEGAGPPVKEPSSVETSVAATQVQSNLATKELRFCPVSRTKDVQALRSQLPIYSEEQGIMELINGNPIVIICGETGSGKTTQVPQFLYEAGYTSNNQMIGITEPRRVAAITMSQRVGYEMGLGTERVSYLIRYEGNVSNKTEMKFMTDGVLLKELQTDPLLTRYSVIIIDEAHERSVFTDILIGLLSRIVPLRNKKNIPLRLIIMSATLRIEDFTSNRKLFPTVPPVFKVDSRQFPVSIHFNKRTPDDYVKEAFKKVCKIHRTLPVGGILVFVTGQQEVNILCRRLSKKFPFKHKGETKPEGNSVDTSNEKLDESDEGICSDDDEPELLRRRRKKKRRAAMAEAKIEKKSTRLPEHVLPKIDLDNYSVNPIDEDDCLQEMDEDSDIGDLLSDDDENEEEEGENLGVVRKDEQPLYVLPLYSMLPPNLQAKVFRPAPNGWRLCVVATNVAETSLTIPNVKYIVDTGKAKNRYYDSITGVSAFHVTWTSKAAANQRAGRAGRTGPGHCYRLYSSAVFNDDFIPFTPPEICRKPIDDLILDLKVMKIEKVLNFPFPTPVDAESIKASEKRLTLLGALAKPTVVNKPKSLEEWEYSSKITPLGHAMACFPVAPKFGKMLALSHQCNLLPYVICCVAALSVQELLCESYSQVSSVDQGESLYLGDAMVLLRAVGAAEYAEGSSQFCDLHGLRCKALTEIRKLRVQLTNAVNSVLPMAGLCVDPKLLPPTDGQARQLRQILLSGLPGSVARKVPECEIKSNEDKQKFRKAYRTMYLEDLVYIHPNSILFREQPEYIVYQEIFETTKMYMRGITAIEPEWLMVYCSSQCTFSKPLEDPPPFYSPASGSVKCYMSATFGRCGWMLPACKLDYPEDIYRIKWFARFLLEGVVFTGLEKYRSILLSAPSTMIKSWAKLQPRTELLLRALQSRNVDCKAALVSAWENDKQFLLNEYMDWLPESSHVEVTCKWPPL